MTQKVRMSFWAFFLAVKSCFCNSLVFLKVVDFRSRLLAFRGAGQGKLRQQYIARRKLIFIFEESRYLPLQSTVEEDNKTEI
jgi:hypothetical protein